MSDAPAPFVVHAPHFQGAPIVFASAHSGRHYPEAFLAAARLDPLTLRRSEDSFVDELFADAPGCGAPLLEATFPRAYCDANREAWELDPAMFHDPLPSWVNTTSARVQSGLGTIARVVASGEAIYRSTLAFADAEHRVRSCWKPWHHALQGLLQATSTRFGACLLIDCHSMPTIDAGQGGSKPADFVLGDAHGTTCAAAVVRRVEAILGGLGYTVARNTPYAGGHITRNYGQPSRGSHALQIEIARKLYMHEQRIEKHEGFAPLRRDLATFMRAITADVASLVAPPAAR